MAKIVKPLVDKSIQAYKAKDKEYSNADGRGLYLRVKPNGSKLWIFLYKHPVTRKNQSMSFGIYPELSLVNARKRRDEARELLANNIDPQKKRDEKRLIQEAKSNNTLKNVSLRWFDIKKHEISSDYADDVWRSLELHVFDSLGAIPLNEITAPIVIKNLQPLAAKGSLETVKRLCQRLNEIMTYSVNTGVIHHNVLSGIKAAFIKPIKKNLPTLLPSQLPSFLQQLNIASIKRVTRCLIEWQLHTMVRPSEAAGTKWSEIDLDKKLWIIPAERMKKKQEHKVPLSTQAIAILNMVSLISGNREHVFPADRNPREHINSSTANMAIKRMGYQGKLVAHGLRSIASTTLNENGFNPDVIEAALAHSDKNEIRSTYNRTTYLEARQELMQWWSDWIDTASTGVNSVTAGAII